MVLNAFVASSAATIFFARTSRRMSWMICSAPQSRRTNCMSPKSSSISAPHFLSWMAAAILRSASPIPMGLASGLSGFGIATSRDRVSSAETSGQSSLTRSVTTFAISFAATVSPCAAAATSSSVQPLVAGAFPRHSDIACLVNSPGVTTRTRRFRCRYGVSAAGAGCNRRISASFLSSSMSGAGAVARIMASMPRPG